MQIIFIIIKILINIQISIDVVFIFIDKFTDFLRLQILKVYNKLFDTCNSVSKGFLITVYVSFTILWW